MQWQCWDVWNQQRKYHAIKYKIAQESQEKKITFRNTSIQVTFLKSFDFKNIIKFLPSKNYL